MQGRGRGQLSFHKAQPVTAPSTIASVTYDDPNGSWESWEPGASWNGTGGGAHSDAPSSNAPSPQASKNEGAMRWDEDGDTNLRHPGKQLPGTLITMSELDWEDTEELATELWRHPMRPRISRDPHARADAAAQRLPARSPVRPDPRHLPMPLPGPGGARPHPRSEEPTARLRMSGPAGLARTGAHPRVNRMGPPQMLPAAPPPRPELGEPEPRRRTTTQPGAASAEQPAALEAAGSSSTAMPADWLDDSSAAAFSPDFAPNFVPAGAYAERMPAEAFTPLQQTPQPAHPSQRYAPPPQRYTPPAAAAPARMPTPTLMPPAAAAPARMPTPTLMPPPPPAAAPMRTAATLLPQSVAPAAHSSHPRRGSLIQTQAVGFSGGPPAQLPPAPPPRPSLPAEPLTHTQSFEAAPPAAAAIESLRERTLTPQRLLPPPPRFPSSAHIPTIIGTPAAAASAVPGRGQQSLGLSGARREPRAPGRDFTSNLLPPSQAQSQLIEQLQEQLLEAMARARVQEARAAEAEKSVEQAEEQLAAVARSHSEESEQLQQQLVQLSQQLQAAEQRAARTRQPDNMLHLAEADLAPRAHKQGRANLILSGLLASSLSFGGAAYFMFYAPLQKQLAAVEQLRTQDSQAHATAVSNLQARSNAERQGLEAQSAELRKQLDAMRAEAAAAATADDGRHGRGRKGAEAESPDGTPAGTRSARAIERRMRRSRAAESDEDEAPRSRGKARRDDGNDPLGGI